MSTLNTYLFFPVNPSQRLNTFLVQFCDNHFAIVMKFCLQCMPLFTERGQFLSIVYNLEKNGEMIITELNPLSFFLTKILFIRVNRLGIRFARNVK
jgi:hypothetical protein